MNRPIRVRFAPSPTGPLHIGGVRTALYNYLFARKNGGKFILRIEDTDQKRYVPGAEKYIIDTLNWLGLEPDEGPLQGGNAIYYRQSERTAIYQDYIKILINEGHAYYAFDTPEELDAMRERLLAAKIPSPKYNFITREIMRNSLVLSADQVQELIQNGTPYVVRLKTPYKEEVRFHDVVRGWIKVGSEELEDKVLMKSDGIPTYHFANVVDDHLMKTSHVIRGEEWIPSTPMHILIYQAFGWQDTMPQFVHLPLLLKPSGEGKLSKRDADQLGFPIFPLSWKAPDSEEAIVGFKAQGYLPEALLNFLALMGWNPGNDKEVLTIDQLIDEFSLNRIGKAGARFDINKAKWLNQQHIKLIPSDKLIAEVQTGLINLGIELNSVKINRICELLKERAIFIQDIVEEAKVFFIPPKSFDKIAVEKYWNSQINDLLREFVMELEELQDLDVLSLKSLFASIVIQNNIRPGNLMPPLRLAISGVTSGPDLMEMLCILGKEEAIMRINNAISLIEQMNCPR
jgi:glutamyl-tRNA synthetase